MSKGPQGVFISYNGDYTELINSNPNTPIFTSQALRYEYTTNSDFWVPLKLTQRLGMPVVVHKLETFDNSFRKYYNEAVSLLSIDFNYPSINLAQPLIAGDCSVFVARADGLDLNWKHVEAMVAFVKQKMGGLVENGLKGFDGDETETDESATAVVSSDRRDAVFAEASLAKVTPKEFNRFFKQYQADRSLVDQAWEGVELPMSQQLVVCRGCGDGGELRYCGNCEDGKVSSVMSVPLYCGEGCAALDAELHDVVYH